MTGNLHEPDINGSTMLHEARGTQRLWNVSDYRIRYHSKPGTLESKLNTKWEDSSHTLSFTCGNMLSQKETRMDVRRGKDRAPTECGCQVKKKIYCLLGGKVLALHSTGGDCNSQSYIRCINRARRNDLSCCWHKEMLRVCTLLTGLITPHSYIYWNTPNQCCAECLQFREAESAGLRVWN